MILSKTPFRISFIGGGTDYCELNKDSPGHIISTTVNKYMYIMLNNKFDNNFRISYSITENVKSINSINHVLIRNTLKYFKINQGLEIITMADIPSSGSGLGSSSALVVGLVNLICDLKKINVSKEKIAKIASEIEIRLCKKKIGLQDQYNTSYGGFNEYKFYYDKKVKVQKIKIDNKRLEYFQKNLLLFYTGINRKTEKILRYSNKKKIINLNLRIKKLVKDFKYELTRGDINLLGKIVEESWIIKKETNKRISNNYFDDIYSLAKKNGVEGGKLLGAGGGGFFLFFANPLKHNYIIRKLSSLNNINFKFSNEGSKIINIDKY